MNEVARSRWNVAVISICFLFVFSAFFSGQMIQPVVLSDYEKASNGTFNSDVGFVSLSIVYAVLGFANFLAPSIVYLLGAKLTVIISGLTYAGYLSSIIIPVEWVFIAIAPIFGFGGALIWCAQGNIIVRNSTPENLNTHFGLFLMILESSWIIGGLIQYFFMSSQDSFDDDTRILLFSIFTAICAVGSFACIIIREGPSDFSEEAETKSTACDKVMAGIRDTVSLLTTKDMIIFSIAFTFHGLLAAFEIAIYPTCMGQNLFLGPKRQSYVGLYSVGLGIGGITGAILTGPLSKYTYHFGRTPVILIGGFLQICNYTTAYLYMPASCSYQESGQVYWDTLLHQSPESALNLATWISISMCLTDVIALNNILQLIGLKYPTKSAAGCALFKLFESVAIAVAFFYSIALPFAYHVLILIVYTPIYCVSMMYIIRKVEKSGTAVSPVPDLVSAADDLGKKQIYAASLHSGEVAF